jgi:hypothetical protein
MSVQSLLDVARTFLTTARRELEDGLTANDHLRVRDAAEKAWNAVVQPTDHVMQVHGRAPLPGRDAHASRRDFLEGIGRRDLSRDYTYFTERLHGDVFYAGTALPPPAARRLLDEVQDFIDKVAAL